MPLHHRDYGKKTRLLPNPSKAVAPHHLFLGMGIVTFVNWAFNFTLAITWPTFLHQMGETGSFAWYGGWCCVGWFLIFL